MSEIANVPVNQKVFQLTSMMRSMLTAMDESTATANLALEKVTQTAGEFSDFRKFAQPILEGKNRISSNQIRILRRTVEGRVRFFAENNALLKRIYFKACYRAIHDACLVSTVTDIPEHLYEHALKCAREWEPTTYEKGALR